MFPDEGHGFLKTANRVRAAVDAEALSRRGRHSVAKCANVIQVKLLRHFFPALRDLRQKTSFLLGGIVLYSSFFAKGGPAEVVTPRAPPNAAPSAAPAAAISSSA